MAANPAARVQPTGFQRILSPLWARIKESGTHLRELWREIRAIVARNWKILVLLLLALALMTAGLMWVDRPLIELFTFPKKSLATPLAKHLSKWGDYQTGIILFCAVFWGVGGLARLGSWRRVAVTMLLAATLGGLAANSLRLTVGRPRPNTGIADGIYGPSLRHKYHSFASAHAATAFGAAGAVTLVCPPAGPVAFTLATAVAWSRLQLGRHRPSDILIGAGLGLAAGIIVGQAHRNRRRRLGDIPETAGRTATIPATSSLVKS